MKIKIGDTLRIASIKGNGYTRFGVWVGKVESIDEHGTMCGTWGDLSVAEDDEYHVVDYPDCTVASFERMQHLHESKRGKSGQKREEIEKEWRKAVDSIVPCVGLPCTICYYSDNRAATVTEIISEKKIEVTHNVVKTIDYYAGDYEVLPDLMPMTDIFTKRRNGQWVMEGHDTKDGVQLMLHYQRHYIDPSF